MAKTTTWTIQHCKTHLALSVCISDGVLHPAEKNQVMACMNDWMPKASMAQRSALLATVSDRMASATSGPMLLEGVVRSARQIHQELDGDRKRMFRFLKQLKGIAEADQDDNPVGNPEARVVRYVSRGLGFGDKVSVFSDSDGWHSSPILTVTNRC